MRAMPLSRATRLVGRWSLAFVFSGVALGSAERLARAQPFAAQGEQTKKEEPAHESQRERVEIVAGEQKSEVAPQKQKKDGEEPDVESDKAIYFSGELAFTRSHLGLTSNLGFDKSAANG